MSGTFDIYTRQSEEGSSDTAAQEAAARAWADRTGVEVHEVVEDTASGALGADDRELGRLIAKCERGDSDGIIVWDDRRFARDVIEGGKALARIVSAGGRLVATTTGFDSEHLTPESEMTFNMMMSIGQAERKRNTLRRKHGKYNKAVAGVWCGGAPPVGYDRVDGKLVPNQDANTVREIFRLRVEGHSFSKIVQLAGEVTANDMNGHKGGGKAKRERRQLTRGGVRHVIMNPAYLGIQVVPDPEGREPKRVPNSHPPLVSGVEWEAANGVPNAAPPARTNLVERYGAELKGIIRCGLCRDKAGRPSVLHVLNPGRYACCRCGGAAIAVSQADGAVADAFTEAVRSEVPEVLAVVKGGEAYDTTLEAVEEAARVLAEYRDSTELQGLLGMAEWTEGLRVRKEAYQQARRYLREQGPAPKRVTDVRKLLREPFHAYLAEVLVFPRKADGPRLTVRWKGAAEAVPVG